MGRRNIAVGRAGNYSAPVDTSGMDPEMKATLGPPKPVKMNKVENAFMTGAKNKDTAAEAVRRARRANK